MNAKDLCVDVCIDKTGHLLCMLVNVTYVSAVHCKLLCSFQSIIIYFSFYIVINALFLVAMSLICLLKMAFLLPLLRIVKYVVHGIVASVLGWCNYVHIEIDCTKIFL